MNISLSRRRFATGALAVVAAAGSRSLPAGAASTALSVQEARRQAQRGEILLLDIRTRQEWAETGIGDVALPVSMHERSFLARLNQLTEGDKSRAVALICATGGRSRSLQSVLARIGYSHIIDVPAGMLGNGREPGWIESGLPVKPYSQ